MAQPQHALPVVGVGPELPSPPTQWYHGRLGRDLAEEILEKDGEEGTYLVRESTSSPGQYALSVFSKGTVHHIQIIRMDEKDACFSIDEGHVTVIYGLDELIKAYSYPAKLVIKNETVTLVKPVICDNPPKDSLRHGATNLLHRSTIQGSIIMVQELVRTRYGNMEGRNELGQTPLHLASIKGHNEILVMLINAGLCDVINARDSAGKTALLYACELDRSETTRILLRAGASPTGNACRQSDRYHPLHAAASRGFIDCVIVLLEFGAALRPRTIENKIPLDLAIEGRHVGTADYLETYRPPEPRLRRNQWYHGKLSRQEAGDLLEECQLANDNTDQTCFLIRRSTHPEYEYALCIIYKDGNVPVKNFFGIEKHDQYYLIEDGPYFPSLAEMVDHYCRWIDGLPVTLQIPVGPTQTFHNQSNRPSTSPSLIPPPLPKRTPRSSPSGFNSLNFLNVNNNDSVVASEIIRSIPSEWIVLGRSLGDGDFGVVCAGKLRIPGKPEMAVAVKRLNDNYISSLGDNKEEFLKEAKIMMDLEHDHIVKLIGFCFEPSRHMMVQELMRLGSMQTYLRENRDQVSLDTIRLWAHQICKGMVYLDRRLVHRDLAARNILLDRIDVVKISDFGLSRKLEEQDYYTASEGGRWPVKWYAPESVTRGKFSHASDVWSFGVTLWEMYTYGDIPWVEYEGREVVELILDGKRLEQPEGCPDSVYEVMQQCWAPEPEDRISFRELVVFFGSSEV